MPNIKLLLTDVETGRPSIDGHLINFDNLEQGPCHIYTKEGYRPGFIENGIRKRIILMEPEQLYSLFGPKYVFENDHPIIEGSAIALINYECENCLDYFMKFRSEYKKMGYKWPKNFEFPKH